MRHLAAELKAAPRGAGPGTWEAVASMATLDRDGEIIDPGAFAPLPQDLPVHAFHDFSDPVGRCVPRYDGGVLFVSGRFASTARAQEIREMVLDGTIGHMSVGFLAAKSRDVDGVRHVTKAELLEVSFVSVPSNREALVLSAKRFMDPVSRARQVAARAAVEVALMDAKEASRADSRRIIAKAERFLCSPEMALAEAEALLRDLGQR